MVPIDTKNAAEAAASVKATPVLSPGSVRRSTTIQQFAAAMVKVQKQIEDPQKNKQAGSGTGVGRVYRYADLVTVLDAVRPALTGNGFAVMQFPCELDGEPALTTQIIHESGEWVETTAKLRPKATDPQSVGSALTYARRYALLALCGIAADDDDDGRAASQPKAAQQKPAQPTDWAIQFAKAVDAATTREQGEKLWREHDANVKADKVHPVEKALIDAAFTRFGTRCPKQPAPQQQPAAK